MFYQINEAKARGGIRTKSRPPVKFKKVNSPTQPTNIV